MRNLILLLVICFSNYVLVFGQLQYNGVIRDAETKREIPYVNIGILSKGVGTVTDEEGRFALIINRNKIALIDTLQISAIGYKTIKRTVGELNFSLEKTHKIDLEPSVYELNEVVLSAESEEIRQRKVGFFFGNTRKIGYWRGITSLGAEMVTKIRVNKRPRQLNEFSFQVLQNASDSLLLRVNVYSGDTPFPQAKLHKENIVFTLRKKRANNW